MDVILLFICIYLFNYVNNFDINRFREYNYRSKMYEKNLLFLRYINIFNFFDLLNKM